MKRPTNTASVTTPRVPAKVIDLGPRLLEHAGMVHPDGRIDGEVHAYRQGARKPLCSPFRRVTREELSSHQGHAHCSVCEALAAPEARTWDLFGRPTPERLVPILGEVEPAMLLVRGHGCALCGTRGRLMLFTMSAMASGPPVVAYGLCLGCTALPEAQYEVTALFAKRTTTTAPGPDPDVTPGPS